MAQFRHDKCVADARAVRLLVLYIRPLEDVGFQEVEMFQPLGRGEGWSARLGAHQRQLNYFEIKDLKARISRAV
jgi:hypothetical protein